MDIPARLQILATIRTGSVYYFEEDQLSSTEPHFFIVLNSNPHTDEFLILVCASSKVDKRREIAQKLGFAQGTLVFVAPSEYSLFTKDTVIDCNRTFEKTTQSLIDKLEQKKLKVCSEMMPIGILEKLVEGVLLSMQVSSKVKQLLSEQPMGG